MNAEYTSFQAQLAPEMNGFNVDPDCSTQSTEIIRIRAPNINNADENFYCVYGDACRNRNDEYWCEGNHQVSTALDNGIDLIGTN